MALEIALKTVMAIARNKGLDVDELCSHSIGAIIADPTMKWVKAEHVPNAIAEIEAAKKAIARRKSGSAQ
ncbi:hypothetical protein I4N56_009600 [Pseudomonas mohnii]|nr:hypothetical protein [Pseudomonas mohnii]